MAHNYKNTTHFMTQLKQGVPAILVLSTWLVLFQGGAQGGSMLAGVAVALLAVLWREDLDPWLGPLSGFLTVTLMVYQPATLVGLSQVGSSLAWLSVGVLWIGWQQGRFWRFLGIMTLLFCGCWGLLEILMGISFFETVRVERQAIVIGLVAAFAGFPAAWYLGNQKVTRDYLKGPFRFAACFVLIGLIAYVAWGLFATEKMRQNQDLTLDEQKAMARQVVAQRGFVQGKAIMDAIRLEDPDADVFTEGYWRRWSGISNKNIGLDDALDLWKDDPQIRNRLLSWLCYHHKLQGRMEAAATTFPIWLKKENRWSCLAQQIAAWDKPELLDELSSEMVFGELKEGARFKDLRVVLASAFPDQVQGGQTISYELQVQSWLSQKLNRNFGQAELYLWGSKAKDVIPSTWFANEAGQAFRQWEMPDYIRPGRYPLYINLRRPPSYRRSKPSGIHVGKYGLFVKWVEVLPTSP